MEKKSFSDVKNIFKIKEHFEKKFLK